MPRRSVAAIVLLCCFACAPVDAPPESTAQIEPEPEPEPTVLVEAETPASPTASAPQPNPPSTPFSPSTWGFVQASSSNGRVVLIRNFGEREPGHFGHHGPGPGEARLDAHDLVAGTSKVVELVSMEPERRWFLLRSEGELWLVDSHTGGWQALADADLESDGNPCLLPRQGNFSAQGKRVGWVRNGAREFRVRDLESGEEWSVPSKGKIWVGWPNDEDQGAVLLEIPAASTQWPQQRTSCSCWWCNRFAMSYGNYGWDGPTFEILAVARDGTSGPGEIEESDFSWHGQTTGGCKLVGSGVSATHGESLEQGPWHWECP